MQVSIPLFIHSDKPEGRKLALYSVRPLLFSGFESRDTNPGKATAKCVSRLRRQMDSLCRRGEYRTAVDQTFAPDCDVQRFRLEIQLKSSFRRGTFVVASFRSLGRKIAFLPALDTIWFEVPKGQTLESRAREVITDVLLQREREGDQLDAWFQMLTAKGRSWVTTVEFDIDPHRKPASLKRDLASFLSPTKVGDGATELENVGRSLDVRYPDGLMRCVRRDALVESLATLLSSDDRRPVLLVGPRSVGKTALIHEVVYRRLKESGQQFRSGANTWLLSPQRLISGMSFVGQWENRLLAILKHARKKKHTLYFDDLVGLYRAGVSRDSDLSVAQVLKPWIERRDVRLLGEITPEGLRVLREQDRSFADLFHIVRVEEPNEAEAIRMLLSVVRELEESRSQFDTNVIPIVSDLCRRFCRDVAFPGSAADMLRSLGAQNVGQLVHRNSVLHEFSQRSGMSMAYIDQMQKLPRETVVQGLRRGIVGQDAAVDAVADRICLARARLNDPGRPLGSFLFAGPTGVGKTQCARALAAYLYGSEDRMVRFDMNEFVSYNAAAQLVGTFRSPEGLLTSAVRRQPFSVVLLDEIEKAHPDVFDLLLQVLGEGRLTDANGNTVDFGNTFVVMTSNLGSTEASGMAGFGSGGVSTGAYVRAIERFFRPEFVNRLDKIIPFLQLDEEQIHAITRRLIEGVSQREGFARRRCIMHPHPRVVDMIVKRGFEPKWGARGVRREIEKTILQPIATQLANATHTTPTIVAMDVEGDRVTARVQPLQDVEPATRSMAEVSFSDPNELLDRIDAFLQRAKDECQAKRPQTELTAGSIDADYFHYLHVMDLIREIEDATESFRLDDSTSADYGNTLVTRPRPGRSAIWRSYTRDTARQIMSEFEAAENIIEFMVEAGHTEPLDPDAVLPRLLRSIGLLNLLLPTDQGWHDDRVLMIFRSLQSSDDMGNVMPHVYQQGFHTKVVRESQRAWKLGYETDSANQRHLLAIRNTDTSDTCKPFDQELQDRLDHLNCNWLLVEGCHAADLMNYEEGTHLCVNGTKLNPVQIVVVPLTADEVVEDTIRRVLDEHDRAFESVSRLSDIANPFRIQPVVRVHNGNNSLLDLRTGITSESPSAVVSLTMSALPMPEELLSASPEHVSNSDQDQ